MEIFKSILPVLFYIVVNSAFSIKIKKGFGKCLPLTFILSILVFYISQALFGTFKFGIYLLLTILICSVIYLFINRKNKQYYLSNGFYVFICLCFIFLFIDFGRHFFWDDEIGFWGKMVKEMIRLDKFYFVDESTLRGHLEYPPFTQLFEFIWCKLSLGYSECNCTYAVHLFEFGIFVPVILDSYFEDKEIWEKLLLDLLISLSIFGIVIYLDAGDIIDTIYNDILLALEFGYCMYLIFFEDNGLFKSVSFGLMLAMIVMTKQAGMAFCMLAIFAYLVNNIRRLKNKDVLVGLIIAIVLPVIAYVSWELLIKPYKDTFVIQFSLSNITIQAIKDVLANGGYQLETIRLYVNALFKRNIYTLPFGITYLSAMLIQVLLLEIIKCFSDNKKDITLYEIVGILGMLGYAFMMLILYAFCYPKEQALVLICYSRYMSSMIGAITLGIVVFAIKEYSNKIFNLKRMFICLLVILTIFDGNRLLNFAPQALLGNRFSGFEKLSNEIDDKVGEGNLLFVVYNHDSNDDYPAFLSYYSEKNHYTKLNRDLYGGDYSDSKELNAMYEELKQYDYIYIKEVSDSFNQYFGPICKEGYYKENTLYKVITKESSITLVEYN